MLESEGKQEQRTCPACSHANRLSAIYCEQCGARLPDIESCPQCGEECTAWQRFCHACGASLTREGPQTGAAPQGSDGSLDAAQGRDSSDLDSFNLRGFSRRVASIFQAVSIRKVVELSSSPIPTDPEVSKDPSDRNDRPGPAIPISSEQFATLGPPETIRANVFWAVVAIVVAVGGQWLLGRGQFAPALGLYAAGIALAVWAFRRNSDDAVPAVNTGTVWEFPPLWLAPILLLPALPAVLSLTRFLIDPKHPPNSFWLLHLVTVRKQRSGLVEIQDIDVGAII